VGANLDKLNRFLDRYIEVVVASKKVLILGAAFVLYLWVDYSALDTPAGIDHVYAIAALSVISVTFLVFLWRASVPNFPNWAVLVLDAFIGIACIYLWWTLFPVGCEVLIVLATMAVCTLRPAIGFTISTLCLIPIVVQYLIFGHGEELQMTYTWRGVQLIALLIFATAVVTIVKERFRMLRELQEHQDVLAQLTRETERNNVLLDLHDHVGHVMVQVPVQLELAQQLIAGGENELAAKVVDGALEKSRMSIDIVRQIVRGLGTAHFEGRLKEAAAMLREEGIRVDAELKQVPPPQSDFAFSMILQEAALNVLLHAHAQKVRIFADRDELVVEDDGVGFECEPDGAGIQEMRARAADLEMDLDFSRSDLGGAKLSLRRTR
jgi:signal transduction histidine kinase